LALANGQLEIARMLVKKGAVVDPASAKILKAKPKGVK